MMRAALLCVVVSIACAQQNTVIQTETRVVLVDAIVTARKGAYLRDLTAKDFRVWEDNREQVLKSATFELARTSPAALVLFFDQASMDVTDQATVRQAAASFIDAQAGPNRKMAVVTFDGSLRIRQNFADNALRLKDALPQPSASGVANPEIGTVLPPVETPLGNQGARNMIAALVSLGENLGALPGRKIVVLFTGRLLSSASQRFAMAEAIEACNRSDVAIYPIDVRPVFIQTQPEPERPLACAGIAAAIGCRPNGDPSVDGAAGDHSQEMLSALANGTGGFVITNSNDLRGGLQKIAAEEDAYYVLSYVPPESNDGSCHGLKVKVDRGGATVRARTSYCRLKPPDLLAGTIAGQNLEKRAAATEQGDIAAMVALPYFYTSPNVARVHVAMEVAPLTLKFEREKGKLHAQIDLLGIASTPDGGVQARFSDSLKFDFDNEAQFRDWRAKPVHYEREFRIAPGRYTFTLAFGDAGKTDTGFGKVTMPLAIDPWNGGELALSGLVLSRELHPAADLGLTTGIEHRTPLIADGTQVVPSASAEFRKGEQGYFYFEANDSDPSSVTLQVRVLDGRTGQTKWQSGLTKLPIQDKSAGAWIPASFRLPLDSLPPGSYRLEIAASDSAGKQFTRTAEFETR
jgi:VWFA-related protein